MGLRVDADGSGQEHPAALSESSCGAVTRRSGETLTLAFSFPRL